MSNISIQSIHLILWGATTPGQSEHKSDSNESVPRIPKAPALLEPHHQIVYSIY